MALVPVRQYLLPRLFKPGHLAQLDAAEYEQAPPLAEQGAQQVKGELGVAECLDEGCFSMPLRGHLLTLNTIH